MTDSLPNVRCPGSSGTVMCKLKKGHSGDCWNGSRFKGIRDYPTQDEYFREGTTNAR